ncbi:hypothetical protein ccbrp13_40230 [Ktedonobacteria bacterium brp13]|nr:hypothetical protein ccbrp13_40230 [Ktedonobacteria bacterium brp13]
MTSKVTRVIAPDFRIQVTSSANATLPIGMPVSFVETVCNISNAAETFPNSVSITGIVPSGLTNVAINGTDWFALLPKFGFVVSPLYYSEKYIGAYPIAAGVCLPPLRISGILNLSAVPVFTLQGTVSAPDDFDQRNKLDGVTLTVTSTIPPVVTPPAKKTVTPTPTVSATLTAVPAPDLVTFLAGSTNTQVGQHLNYIVTVCNGNNADLIHAPGPIELSSVLPLGMDNISITGTDWHVSSLSSSVGPALLTVYYAGRYPVVGGQCLSPLSINGSVLASAQPGMTTSVGVLTPNDVNSSNASTMLTTFVSPALPITPTLTPIPTPAVSAPRPVLTQVLQNGSWFNQGQTVKLRDVLCNQAGAGPITSTTSLSLMNTLPPELTNLSVTGRYWTTQFSSMSGSAVIFARYRGSSSLPGGACLPPLYVQGTVGFLASHAVLTSTSLLNTPLNLVSHQTTSSVKFEIALNSVKVINVSRIIIATNRDIPYR